MNVISHLNSSYAMSICLSAPKSSGANSNGINIQIAGGSPVVSVGWKVVIGYNSRSAVKDVGSIVLNIDLST